MSSLAAGASELGWWSSASLDVRSWPAGRYGPSGVAAKRPRQTCPGRLGGAVHGELDAAGVAEVQVNDPPAGEGPPGPRGQGPLIGGLAVHADPRPYQRGGLEGDRHRPGVRLVRFPDPGASWALPKGPVEKER
jgi:hypothetical protein